jgi:hypothetical protein
MACKGGARRTLECLAATTAIALVWLSALPARAQDSTRASAAEQLFHDGRALILQHRYKDACDKLASSQKLEPAVGTLFSLGECNIGQGKTASAWLAYERAVALANERRDPRAAGAAERATAVEPQLSRLVLRMVGDARSFDGHITVNGDALVREVLLEPMPVDPGPATIVVSAPGYRTWSARVQVGAAGDTVSVVIPPLERLPDASEVARERASATIRRVVGLGVGGGGLAAIGVGSVLGMQAIVKIRDANALCPGSLSCNNHGALQENSTGKTFADASSVVIPVGVALLGLGSYLYLTTKSPGGAEVSADVASNGGRIRVGWSW